jgi:hypothetical protein
MLFQQFQVLLEPHFLHTGYLKTNPHPSGRRQLILEHEKVIA